MKKIVFLTLFLMMAWCGFAQQPLYDFSAICESGQRLYFKKLLGESQKVMVTYPSHEYAEHPKPIGDLIIPTTVAYNDTIYTVTQINNGTFFFCDSLTSVVFSDSLERICNGAFGQCTRLAHISAFPETLIDLGSNTFYYCYQLLEPITIPAQITELKSTVFKDSGITAIHIPAGVISIKQTAFSGCRQLRSIEVDDANPVYDSRNHCNALIETATNTLFLGCKNTNIPFGVTSIASGAFSSSGKHIILPNSVERLEDGAFLRCDSLFSITLPSSVSYIGDKALGCLNLTSITSRSSVPPTAVFEAESGLYYHNSFYNVDTNIPVYIPRGSINAYKTAPGWSYFHQFIELETYYDGEWYYEILNDNGSITYQYLQCVGDTTINNERTKIVVRTNQIYDKSGQTEVTRECLFEREGVVYWWNKELQEFTVLYDLTAEVGDEWEIKVGAKSIVMHVDAVGNYEYDGKTYKMLRVSDSDHLFSGDIVCGVGHLTSFFPEKLMNQDKGYRVEGIRCFWQDENLVFQYGDKDCDEVYEQHHHGVDETDLANNIRIYPNPTTGLLYVETCQDAFLPLEYRITNIMGQTLLSGTVTKTIDVSMLPTGLYFITLGDQTLKFTKQ
ncbi:MAG: leucine-rich repeat domain-containing protein [Bacteroidales bacterium]|nr:leucine-rich repeat domain-containing protein [Bacteroidales bacterium]